MCLGASTSQGPLQASHQATMTPAAGDVLHAGVSYFFCQLQVALEPEGDNFSQASVAWQELFVTAPFAVPTLPPPQSL